MGANKKKVIQSGRITSPACPTVPIIQPSPWCWWKAGHRERHCSSSRF